MADVLAALRSLMASHSPPIDALAVPSEDYHQSEYVSARDRRREFVSGFSGSAGLALITASEALLWTDGRYFLQAAQQLSNQWKLMRIGEDPVVEKWISDNLPNDSTVGVDLWCISIETAQRWQRLFADKQQKLIQTAGNLVDEVWTDRPVEEIKPVTVQPISFSGKSVAEKLKDLRENLALEKAFGIIITSLDEVAWLYNIRGDDVPYCPVVHAFAIVKPDSASLFVDRRKVSTEVASYLEENGITVEDYDNVSSDVQKLGVSASQNEGKTEGEGSHLTWVSPATCCYALFSKLEQDKLLLEPSPISLAKALKNPVELQGLKDAHVRDGAAVVQYLAWLDEKTQEIYGASGYFSEAESTKKKPNSPGSPPLTEVSISDKLEAFRASKQHFKGLSFPTISSIGPNAAIIHYAPEEGTCSEFDPDSIYLFDSGAQYQDGTTDITRTVHFGRPTDHEKTCYTLVLKGHIALGDTYFPKGTNGHALDVMARTYLWKVGLDYRHGTGHGVGSYLNVHEGPQCISFKPQVKNVPLEASMTVTDEPGYYEDGNFGIRLENVLVVKEADTLFNFGGKGFLSFEHITWAPYQKKLMELRLLTEVEVEWLDSYHSKCRQVLTPFLSESEVGWLVNATEPILGISN